MSKSNTEEFGPWRAFLWPVHNYELKKLIPMLGIFFFIAFNYNVLRTLKDSLIVTAKASGAEVIPFIKVWVLLPGAIALTWLFNMVSSRWSRERTFYIILSFFLCFFILFLALYPYCDQLHPHKTADWLTTVLPVGFKGLIAMYRYWLFTAFYVMSELWQTIILAVLFWGFANHVTRLNEAKRFYGLFGIGANLSGIFAGEISIYLLKHQYSDLLPYGKNSWDQSLFLILMTILASGVITSILFRYLNGSVLRDPRFYDPSMKTKEKPKEGRTKLRENFRILLSSKYLISMAAIVVAYNVVINLVEVLWKAEVKELYPNPSDYSVYMNQVSVVIGFIATVSALVVSGNAIRRFGWTFTAMITPCILFFTSICFFGFFFAHEWNLDFKALSGVSPLTLVVFFGTLQNCLSRGAKYTVFDATKEMAFIPLDPKLKLNGKAAIDGVCSRLGKSGGALIHSSLLLTFSTLSASAPYVGMALFAVIVIWGLSVRNLGRQFNELTQPQPTRVKPVKEGAEEMATVTS